MSHLQHDRIYYVMGVSGCGKSTIGQMLAESLGIPFFDGDDYHPPANVKKMASGIPLNDEDRHEWLLILNDLAKDQAKNGAVIVCSALKKRYRNILSTGLSSNVKWVYLEGTFGVIMDRLKKRKGHFMPASLLQSQFETLEIPKNAIRVTINQTPEQILEDIIGQLNK